MDESWIKLSGGFNNEIYYIPDLEQVVRISVNPNGLAKGLQELEWMKYLYRNGVTVPQTFLIEERDGKVVTYFEYIRGRSFDVTDSSFWNESTFTKLGRILGKMHALSKQFNIAENHRPVYSNANPDVFDIEKNLEPWTRDCYKKLLRSLAPFVITADSFGLIHNDFHQGNLILDENGEIVVIDFDDCSYNWFAQDMAVFFYHAYWQHSSFNGDEERFKANFLSPFFKGYQSENLLHKDTLKQIPIFLKLREIYLYQLFNRVWDQNNLEEWQTYTIQDLEDKIKSGAAYAGIRDFSLYLD
ncbi:phosphotransferase enzyme family protein [Pseudoneobacillus sp. C159]